MATETPTATSYRDAPGLTNRANSALLRIEAILEDRHIPSAVRLVRIAEIMATEPVLTSGAAYGARRESARLKRIANRGSND